MEEEESPEGNVQEGEKTPGRLGRNQGSGPAEEEARPEVGQCAAQREFPKANEGGLHRAFARDREGGEEDGSAVG